MANPQNSSRSPGGGHVNHSGDENSSSNLQTTKPVPWPRTKKTFYIWWIVLEILPFLLAVGGLVGAFVALFSDETKERGPGDLPLPLVCLITTLQLLAQSTLLYYVCIKLRALHTRINALHRAAAGTSRSSAAAGQGGGSRWLIGFDSALEMEEWFMDRQNLKAAGILLGMSTVWIAVAGMTFAALLVLVMFLGTGGVIGGLGGVVGGVSFLGHLIYVWGRSVKILVLGAWRRGRGGRRPGGDVEEGDEEHGERLLPLGAAA
ncbi:hypothetical protein V8F06_013861 [Rhypophila decipiens]